MQREGIIRHDAGLLPPVPDVCVATAAGTEGIFREPASAAWIAVVIKSTQEGLFGSGSRIVRANGQSAPPVTIPPAMPEEMNVPGS